MFHMQIKDLQATTTLGVYAWEQEAKRQVILNIKLHAETDASGTSDKLDDAVDYANIESRVLAHLEAGNFQLLERLVTEVATLILSLDKRIAKVRVEADKPGALRMARSVSVATERRQS